MSAAELSKKIKSVNMRAVQAIAQGVRKPSVEVAQEIAKALRVKLDDIL